MYPKPGEQVNYSTYLVGGSGMGGFECALSAWVEKST